jgi:hypothetical protein
VAEFFGAFMAFFVIQPRFLMKLLRLFLLGLLVAFNVMAQQKLPNILWITSEDNGPELGGLLGGVIGHNKGRKTAEGAAIGALGGAVLGGAIGNRQDKQSGNK